MYNLVLGILSHTVLLIGCGRVPRSMCSFINVNTEIHCLSQYFRMAVVYVPMCFIYVRYVLIVYTGETKVNDKLTKRSTLLFIFQHDLLDTNDPKGFVRH